jgi:uncharacterized protein YndB with AHSA1/START domain
MRAGPGRENIAAMSKRNVLVGVAAVVGVLLLVVVTRPSTFHIERSTTIAAPPDAAFAQVDDFHAWAAWSPYEKLDLDMKKTFEGPPSGVGAVYAWSGNDKAGEGRMTITTSDKPARVVIRLEFSRPFAATNTATFTFAPAGEGTKVTWAMEGANGFVAKAFSLFVDMDMLIGGDFERGLAAMKTVVESRAKGATEAKK